MINIFRAYEQNRVCGIESRGAAPVIGIGRKCRPRPIVEAKLRPSVANP